MLRRLRFAPLALLLVAVACADSNKITGPKQNGTSTQQLGTGKGFTLLLTDAPGDVEAAVVTISQITLQGTGGSVSLLDHPFTGDLLDLRNEVATLVRGFDVPAGSYSQLRLVISGAYIQVGDQIYASSPGYAGLPAGVHPTGTLQMPSFGTSGLKIDLPGGKLDIGADETIVMIDFDAQNSFGHQAGNSGKWVMHPVIKATNVTFGGNLVAQLQLGNGVTLPQLNGQTITLGAFQAVLTPVGGGTPDTVTLVDTNNDGIFEAMFKGLVPGQYTLTFLSPTGLLTTFAPVLPITVTVAQKTTTTQTVTLASAALPGSITATLGLANGVTLPSIGSPPTAVTLGQFKAVLTFPSAHADTLAFTQITNSTLFAANFPNLVPGTYSLNVLKPAGITVTYSVTLPQSINLTSGLRDTAAITINTATAP